MSRSALSRLGLFRTGLLFSMLFSTCCTPRGETEQGAVNEEFFLEEISVRELQAAYESGKYNVTGVVQAYLDRIEAIDREGPALNSILVVNPDALEIAAELDRELAEGKRRGPMHGVPVILKDNIDTHDKMPTTAGSRSLAESIAPDDSWVAARFREAGAVIIAKANLSEWANFRNEYSSSGWSGVGGQTRNPYVLDRNPCGSSSGSAAAVSANLCAVAIGTETNGSIVCPSHACGVVGLKPTVGLISRSGIIPISFTQDTPGPMARSVEDVAICLGVLTGIDPEDSKTDASEGNFLTDYTGFLKKDGLRGKRIGLLSSAMGYHQKVDELMKQTVSFLNDQGAEIIELEFPGDRSYNRNSYQVLLYEFKDGLNRYFASLGSGAAVHSLEELIRFNQDDPVELEYFGQDVLILAESKGSLEDKEYLDAKAAMEKATREEGIDRLIRENGLDALMAPTGAPAWKTDLLNGDNYKGSSSSYAAISGYPNITVPMGFVEGLPVGLSFFGQAWTEGELIEIAYAFEQASRVRKAPEFLETD